MIGASFPSTQKVLSSLSLSLCETMSYSHALFMFSQEECRRLRTEEPRMRKLLLGSESHQPAPPGEYQPYLLFLRGHTDDCPDSCSEHSHYDLLLTSLLGEERAKSHAVIYVTGADCGVVGVMLKKQVAAGLLGRPSVIGVHKYFHYSSKILRQPY